MRGMLPRAIAACLALGCLPAATVQSQISRPAREEAPPAITVRIDGRRAAGAGELRVAPDMATLGTLERGKAADLVLYAGKQRIELRGSGTLARTTGLTRRLRATIPMSPNALTVPEPALRLRYEQRIEPDGRRVFVSLFPLAEQDRALLVHVDLGGPEPIRKEILPGLFLTQRDEPGRRPDVNGAAARRTWLKVEIQDFQLDGGQTRTITYRGASYQLHVYRSLRRDAGTDPTLPFEGEKYLLSATLTPL